MGWQRGKTLITPNTKRWTKEQVEENDKIEQRMIFSHFSALDSGRERRLVCVLNPNNIDYERNAKLIEASPDLYAVLKEIHDITSVELDNPVIKEDLYNKIDALIKHLS